MAAQRATAAEKTAPAGSMELLGDVLRLGRGGSGCSVSGGPGGPGAVDLMGGAPWCGAQWLCLVGRSPISTHARGSARSHRASLAWGGARSAFAAENVTQTPAVTPLSHLMPAVNSSQPLFQKT